jgi:hypothetical protein
MLWVGISNLMAAFYFDVLASIYYSFNAIFKYGSLKIKKQTKPNFFLKNWHWFFFLKL